MKFNHNQGRTPEFSHVFNQIAWKVFDDTEFFVAAEKAGYVEARVLRPGSSALIENRHSEDRINAQIDENGRLRRYIFG